MLTLIRHRAAAAAFIVPLMAACGQSPAAAVTQASPDEAACTTDCVAQDPTDTTLAFFKTYFPTLDATSDGVNITLKSNGLPSHKSPYFDPADARWEAFDTMGGTRFQNPNRIAEQAFELNVPINPEPKGISITSALVDRQGATSSEEYHGMPMGLCLDGVAMFHGVAAPGDDIAQEEHTFDQHEGHPEKTGVYHHHSGSPGPLEVLKEKGLVSTTVLGQAEVEFFAVMCDGTLVFGCTELDGSTPDSADFDAQNGHVHDIADATTQYFVKRYHTHVCRSKYTGDLYAPEIQYYKTCGAAQPPPPQHAH